MVEVFSPLVLAVALVLGLEHAFDADHVVAISTILSDSKSVRKSLLLGTVWGLGHSVTIFIVGGIVLALRVMIPQSIENLFEGAAGFVLMILGVYVIRGLIIEKAASSKSSVADPHLHPASHQQSHSGHNHTRRSLLAGAVQGLGGSAAVMLVALSTVESATIGAVFIAIFALGVIIGMLGIGALIGGLLVFTALHVEKIHQTVRAIAGCVSIGFGIFIILTILLMGKTFL
jgi:cytochrome c biogenesis protein CcdA